MTTNNNQTLQTHPAEMIQQMQDQSRTAEIKLAIGGSNGRPPVRPAQPATRVAFRPPLMNRPR